MSCDFLYYSEHGFLDYVTWQCVNCSTGEKCALVVYYMRDGRQAGRQAGREGGRERGSEGRK